jgi:lysophospholipase L1-like esterase
MTSEYRAHPARSAFWLAAKRFSGTALVALTVGAALTVAPTGPATAAPAPINCPAPGPWVGAWGAPASDSSARSIPTDPSGDLAVQVENSTVRSIITPTRDGQVLRVRLSNLFGTAPLTFGGASAAKQTGGAKIAAPVPLLFNGQVSVTVPAGADVVSDPTVLPFAAGESLAISTYVPTSVDVPTRHFAARQHSYQTDPGVGDQTFEVSEAPFDNTSTSRLFVTGMDVLTPGVGAVVAFGDSLTDGYRGTVMPPHNPESPVGLDELVRWPDFLAARINAKGVPLTVVNAGITGNMVTMDGTSNPAAGPSALSRLNRDVLSVPNVSTVVLFEGINDLGHGATFESLTEGYQSIIATLHQRGIRVVQGTITPAGANASYGVSADPTLNPLRIRVNEWILESSPADSIVDFDKAIADPADPSYIRADLDGGDGLHLTPAGYQLLANTISLEQIKNPCSAPSGSSSWGSAA